MSIDQINAIKHAVMEVVGLIFFLVFLTVFALACMGFFDKE